MSVVEKLASSLTDEQMEKVGQRVSSFMESVRNDPKLRSEALTKVAWMPDGATVKKLLGLAAGGGAFGLGAMGASKAYDHVSGKIQAQKDSVAKAKNYQQMVKANPQLSSQGMNSREVQRHFNTLHKFNPEYASDPVVAGTYVLNSMEMSRPSIDAVNNIVKARGDIMNARSKASPAPSHTLVKGISGVLGAAGKLTMGA